MKSWNNKGNDFKHKPVNNKSKQTKEVKLILPKEYQGKEFNTSFNSNFKINGNILTLNLADNSFDILIAKN